MIIMFKKEMFLKMKKAEKKISDRDNKIKNEIKTKLENFFHKKK